MPIDPILRKVRAAYRLVDAAIRLAKTREGRNRCKDVQVYSEGYAEPGYDGDVVALGNWNACSRYNRETQRSEDIDGMPARLGEALEKLGVAIEWSDEWTTCDECGKLVRTSPDSYSWTPSYKIDDDSCETLCHECI